jgi:hypothetical protein
MAASGATPSSALVLAKDRLPDEGDRHRHNDRKTLSAKHPPGMGALQATPPPAKTRCRRRAEAGPSPPLRLVIAGRRRQTAAIREAHRHYEKAAAMTGVALTIFSHSDPATGDHQICILTSETGFFELERQAQRRSGEMAHAFTAQGYNVPPDCFYVTTGRPGAFDTGKPPAHRVTLQ